MGTLGSGNHYLEIQVARPENTFDPDAARRLGITFPGQVVILFHCGSRGFGHQVASDYLRLFLGVILSLGSILGRGEVHHDFQVKRALRAR